MRPAPTTSKRILPTRWIDPVDDLSCLSNFRGLRLQRSRCRKSTGPAKEIAATEAGFRSCLVLQVRHECTLPDVWRNVRFLLWPGRTNLMGMLQLRWPSEQRRLYDLLPWIQLSAQPPGRKLHDSIFVGARYFQEHGHLMHYPLEF